MQKNNNKERNMKKIFPLLCILIGFTVNGKSQSSDVTTEEVRFVSEGVTLAGTIYTPQHSQAAAVIVHGSDRTPRMSEFASQLAASGISVLTYDKRGVGESGGVYAGPEVGTNNIDRANLTLLAMDASAAVDVLHQRNKHASVGLVGFSQAGWIIPIAANKNSQVDFMVIFCGPVIPTLEQLRFQFLTNGDPDFWDSHTEAQAREHIRNGADRYQFENTDPCDALGTLSIPGIWLWGGRDIQVPVGLSIERLNALKVQGKPFEYCLFPKLGHNVAFGDSAEPVDIAILWIKNRKHYVVNPNR